VTDWLASSDAQALVLSLKVAGLATLASLPFGVAVAWVRARKRFFGHDLLNGLVHLPLILPPVVTGYLLLITFGRKGWVGGFLADHLGIVRAFRWTGAALAAAVMAFPLLVRAIRMAFEAVDPGLESAAATLGARPATVFLTVSLPLALPGVLAGMVTGFAKAMGEFGATITFVANIPGQTQTLPTAIYTALQVPGGGATAAKLVAISIAIAMLALLLSEVLARRVAARIRGRR
jgi:molybdate transport system permease protein